MDRNDIKPAFRIYSKDGCPHCENAKALLKRRSLSFEVVDLSDDDERRKFYAATSLRTVPAIFALEDGAPVKYVGGYTALVTALNATEDQD